MKLNSTGNDPWKLCTYGIILGCFILFLFLNQPEQNTSLSASRNITTTQMFTAIREQDPHTSMIIEVRKPSILTTNPIHQQAHNLGHVEKSPNATEIIHNFTQDHINKSSNSTRSKCNIFEGRWVYKPEQVPSYSSNTCPFLEEKMSCRKNGRPDFEYEKWTWRPKDCDIPLFNGKDMLERLRNKRMIIVGDSLNRNMWESLACLLYSSIPSSRVEVQAKSPSYKVFIAKGYNFRVEFYWSPFLVELDANQKNGKHLVLDKLSPSSKQWRGADIMVFNSGHWWIPLGKLKTWEHFHYEGIQMKHMPMEKAYEIAMRTWARWIQAYVDPKKTIVFFRSISPEHKRKQWCYNATQPITDESYQTVFPKSSVDIIEGILKEMMSKNQVKYLNITKMSSYRRDAHPSVYRSWKWRLYTSKYKRFLENYADCIHWCLPGLPDTWNRLLYASLFYHSFSGINV